MLKKWLCFLLAFGLMNTQVWAQYDDDDDDDDYEEEIPKKPSKKAAPKKAAKKSEPSNPGRFGLQVSFSGDLGNNAIGFVYDLGNSLEFGVGVGLYRRQETPNEGDAGDPEQSITGILGISYTLGKGLLDYGIGFELGVIKEPISYDRPDGGTSLFVIPNFYTQAELVKNVSLKLSAGIMVDKPAEYPNIDRGNNNIEIGSNEMTIRFVTSGTVIFYFM